MERIRRDYPVALHGVGLSICSREPLREGYLKRLRQLVDRYQPIRVSDHLSWSLLGGVYYPDLYPPALTHSSLDHLVPRIQQVQDLLQRPLLLENIARYLSVAGENAEENLPEWEFINQMCRRCGCKLLLDVNNLWVNEINQGDNAETFLDRIDPSFVAQIHLSGAVEKRINGQDFCIDSHDRPVAPAVWNLYGRALANMGPVATLIEWDTNLPALEQLLAEGKLARSMIEKLQMVPPSIPRTAVETADQTSLETTALDVTYGQWQNDFIRVLEDENFHPAPVQLHTGASTNQLPVAARLNVYRNHLRLTLRELLTSAYPRLQRQLGETNFAYLTAKFCLKQPMNSPEAWRFGEGLGKYLASRGDPIWGDLAHLEWAAQCCFYAPEEPPLQASELAALDPQQLTQLRVLLSADVRLLNVLPQAYAYWSQTLPGSQSSPSCLLLMKRESDGAISLESIDPGSFAGLLKLASAREDTSISLLDACQMALKIEENFDVASFYRYCLTSELLVNSQPQ